MKKGSGKKYAFVYAGIGIVFVVFVFLLASTEMHAPDATINNIGDAFWYSLTTLTTVGYGDTYPVTFAGRIFGAILQFLSAGVFLLVISTIFTALRSRFLPTWRMLFKKKKDWYIFTESNSISTTLARGIRHELPDSVVIFSDTTEHITDFDRNVICADMSVEELLAFKKKTDNAHVILLSSDFSENEKRAADLQKANCPVYVMSNHEPNELPVNIRYFDPYECAARIYWQKYPITSPSEKILIIGHGKYADAILENAFAYNVFNTLQHITYHVFGPGEDFKANHKKLFEYLESGKAEFCDTFTLFDGDWREDEKLLSDADRIIICEDDVILNTGILSDLRRYFPVRANVYVMADHAEDEAIAFGTGREIYLPETVLKMKLNEAAVQLHNTYLKSTKGSLPSWNELGSFLRRSNTASADHLRMKIRILLGTDHDADVNAENCREAFEKYKAADEPQLDICRRIEHERWVRFHVMNNWKYSAVRDNAQRQHPLICPYDELSNEDKKKDEFAWELLGVAAQFKGIE